MSWVDKLWNEIGMERMLQDILNEIITIQEPEQYIVDLYDDLNIALHRYKERNKSRLLQKVQVHLKSLTAEQRLEFLHDVNVCQFCGDFIPERGCTCMKDE